PLWPPGFYSSQQPATAPKGPQEIAVHPRTHPSHAVTESVTEILGTKPFFEPVCQAQRRS
ncbi:MAG: hypothetical protein O3A73_09045, partial [Proteobacteria bacterium]|nr:hypothetical protein [Pseudomonadota bacterium]